MAKIYYCTIGALILMLRNGECRDGYWVRYLQRLPLTSALIPSVLTLDQQCFGGFWSEAGYRRELASPNSQFTLLIQVSSPNQGLSPTISPALESASAYTVTPALVIGIGCFWMILEEAHITLVGIAPPYQGQGLGRLLLWDLLHKAHQQGLERATLEVRESNQPALKLYERFKFQTVGRRRRYYPDGEDALILWRGGLHQEAFLADLQQWQQLLSSRLSQQGWQLIDAK